jgi:hypothetical protein
VLVSITVVSVSLSQVSGSVSVSIWIRILYLVFGPLVLCACVNLGRLWEKMQVVRESR